MALITTGFVAAGYLLIALAVTLLVTHNLTSAIDGNLSQAVGNMVGQRPISPGGQYNGPPEARPYAEPVLWWRYLSDGRLEVASPAANAAIPAQDKRVISSPITISLDGQDVRLMSARSADGDLVFAAQSTANVDDARSTLIFAELLVAPVLLGLVFFGALAIGRRVGTPIERARQRQLEFTANASHELRTPLSVIEAQASLALAHDRDGEWYRRAFLRVDQEGKRMRRMVEDLLWLARLDATSSRSQQAEQVDLGVMAEQAVERFASVAESRHQRLSASLAGDSSVISGSPEWLDRLLGVLLDNACKYTPEGGTIEVRVGELGDRVQLSVDDSGPGIPAQDRARIFDRFQRASDKPGGAGLGLSIADAVVRATNGRWEIGDAVLGGTSMRVSWARALSGGHRAQQADQHFLPVP